MYNPETQVRSIEGRIAANSVLLLSRDYVILVVAGCAVGISIVYQLLKTWLQVYVSDAARYFTIFATGFNPCSADRFNCRRKYVAICKDQSG